MFFFKPIAMRVVAISFAVVLASMGIAPAQDAEKGKTTVPKAALKKPRALGQEPETLVTTVRDKTKDALAPVNADSIKSLDAAAKTAGTDSSMDAGSRGVLQQ
jgi:hypothetical protein